MSEMVLHAALAAAGAGLLALLAAFLVSREAAHRDLVQRARLVTRSAAAGPLAPARTPGGVVLGWLARLGDALRGTFLFSEADAALLERSVRAIGLEGRRAVAAVMGAKTLLLVLCPALAYGWAASFGYGSQKTVLAVLLAMAFGSFAPNWILNHLRRRYVDSLRKGLPDALDLLVVCTEAGLGLESALERVRQEMRRTNPTLAAEVGLLLHDLRLSTDRRTALARLAERTGVDSFQRLSGTLAQTLRYGTPLGQALRILAAEMRQERMMRIEEKAARLPALLVLPLILFILPCLFIVLAGPAGIRILNFSAGLGAG